MGKQGFFSQVSPPPFLGLIRCIGVGVGGNPLRFFVLFCFKISVDSIPMIECTFERDKHSQVRKNIIF